MKVPFVDLKAQYNTIRDEVQTAMSGVVENTAFIGGKYVETFEKEFAEFCGAKYAVGVSSGTSALHLALAALGIGAGDEVITAANTFIATTEAISHAGARPRLVDMRPEDFTIDISRIEAAITDRTRAVIPVHLYGQMAQMDAIAEMAKRHNLVVVEDAAQAQGAEYMGKRAGSYGHAAGFSFYPAKNLGAYGDAGIVVTDDKAVADRVRLLANHGRRGANDHSVEGYNERLDGIQAAVLSAKLPHLDDWNQMRHRAAERYDKLLSGLNLVTPIEMPGAKHIYHLYVVRVKSRDRVKQALEVRGVSCGLHYPIPIHLLDAYKHLNLPRGSYPFTEVAADEILSLPMYAEITSEQQQYVADCLKEIVGEA
ncbi:MAG: DegT/DnrJ/EryC1/StrS family aminotransferase [Candidatus Eisenbacteria bacterium]